MPCCIDERHASSASCAICGSSASERLPGSDAQWISGSVTIAGAGQPCREGRRAAVGDSRHRSHGTPRCACSDRPDRFLFIVRAAAARAPGRGVWRWAGGPADGRTDGRASSERGARGRYRWTCVVSVPQLLRLRTALSGQPSRAR